MLKQYGYYDAWNSLCKAGKRQFPGQGRKQTAGPGRYKRPQVSYHVVLNLLKVFMAYLETCQQTLKNLLTEIKR